MVNKRQLAMALVASAIGTRACQALVFLGSGDANHNTTPPTGALADSGWQWQSQSGFGATVIGTHLVATANHLGISAGRTFTYGGLTYHVVAATNEPESDLRLFWVAGRIPNAAPIYYGSQETNSYLVFHGFGGPRGNPVYFDPPANTDLRGWLWTSYDGRLRWGTNLVSDVATVTVGVPGEYLISYFTQSAGEDVISFSPGDSGGGAFILDSDGKWKLAGVITAVEAEFRTTADSSTFYAALFNREGFYEPLDVNTWGLDPDASKNPGVFIQTTRISAYGNWIKAQLAAPYPGSPVPVLLTSKEAGGPFVEVNAYAIDPTARQITFPTPDTHEQFYQLSGFTNIVSIVRKADRTTLLY